MSRHDRARLRRIAELRVGERERHPPVAAQWHSGQRRGAQHRVEYCEPARRVAAKEPGGRRALQRRVVRVRVAARRSGDRCTHLREVPLRFVQPAVKQRETVESREHLCGYSRRGGIHLGLRELLGVVVAALVPQRVEADRARGVVRGVGRDQRHHGVELSELPHPAVCIGEIHEDGAVVRSVRQRQSVGLLGAVVVAYVRARHAERVGGVVVRRVELHRALERGDRLPSVGRDRGVVGTFHVEPLATREPVAQPERRGERRVGLRHVGGAAQRHQRVRHLHVGHRERAVLLDRVVVVPDGRRIVAEDVVRVKARRVAAQRADRRRGHLIQPRRGAHRLQRLADLLAQLLGEPVHRGDELSRVLRRFAERRELVAVLRRHETRGHDVAAPGRHDAPRHDRLGAGSQRDLARGAEVHARAVGALHLLERRDHFARRHDAHRSALRQSRTHRFGDRGPER